MSICNLLFSHLNMVFSHSRHDTLLKTGDLLWMYVYGCEKACSFVTAYQGNLGVNHLLYL